MLLYARSPQRLAMDPYIVPLEVNTMRVWPGSPYPLGATWDGKGVNFALFSEHATRVELCLFDGVEAAQEDHRKLWQLPPQPSASRGD
jgi:pullulanase/glycogen debranching enzyme